jgi:HAD superfamily hydrolase (TIGR01490 family)
MATEPEQQLLQKDHAVSIFDLDRTLTRHGTYSPFLLFAARRLAPWRLLLAPFALVAMLGYGVKLLSRAQLKSAMHRLLLGKSVDAAVIARLARSFATHTVQHNACVGAQRLLAAEKAVGRHIVIATASHRFYAVALAEAFGADALIATESIWDRGRLTPALDGKNCYGPAKRMAIELYLEQQGLKRDAVHLRFYSDHVSDAPCFDFADEPIAINPSSKLAQLAKAKGWKILTLQ